MIARSRILSALVLAAASIACAQRVSKHIPQPVQEARTATIGERNALVVESTPDAPDAPDAPRWYGWQTAMATAGSAALIVTGVLLANSERDAETAGKSVLTAGVLTYAIVPPIIHAAHGNGTGGFGSLALLSVGPLALGAAGSLLAELVDEHPDHVEYDIPIAGIVALVAGAIAAPIIDAAIFAYEEPAAD